MRREILAMLATAVAASLSGCGNQTERVRYRLTARVNTPAGVKTGFSVIEVNWHTPSALTKNILNSQASGSYTVRGEAVSVDLPNLQTLFVLLRSSTSVDWAAWVLPQIGDGKPVPVPREWHYGPGSRGEMTDNYPSFVRFKDVANPMSVDEIDPDDLEASFGPDYALESLTFQRTDDAVTTGIERRLNWIEAMGDHDFNADGSFGDRYPPIVLGLVGGFRN